MPEPFGSSPSRFLIGMAFPSSSTNKNSSSYTGSCRNSCGLGLGKQVAGSNPLRISDSDLNPVERAVMSYVAIGAKRYSLIPNIASVPITGTEV